MVKASDGASHYDVLMMNYAAGILDQAQSLVLEAHIALSEAGRRAAHNFERLGGVMLERHCEPVPMRSGQLENILGRLDRCAAKKTTSPTKRVIPQEARLPDCTMKSFACECAPNARWKSIYPGLDVFALPLECTASTARFMRARPAFETPPHTHSGLEIMLVLDGAIRDEDGLYRRGDLIVSDETDTHATKACPEQGCVCLVVTSGPIRLTGLASLLNPFIRF